MMLVMMMVVMMMMVMMVMMIMMTVMTVVMVMMMVVIVDQLHIWISALVGRHPFGSSISSIGNSQNGCGVWDRVEELRIRFRALNITQIRNCGCGRLAGRQS
jgi:hypothetical protein